MIRAGIDERRLPGRRRAPTRGLLVHRPTDLGDHCAPVDLPLDGEAGRFGELAIGRRSLDETGGLAIGPGQARVPSPPSVAS